MSMNTAISQRLELVCDEHNVKDPLWSRSATPEQQASRSSTFGSSSSSGTDCSRCNTLDSATSSSTPRRVQTEALPSHTIPSTMSSIRELLLPAADLKVPTVTAAVAAAVVLEAVAWAPTTPPQASSPRSSMGHARAGVSALPSFETDGGGGSPHSNDGSTSLTSSTILRATSHSTLSDISGSGTPWYESSSSSGGVHDDSSSSALLNGVSPMTASEEDSNGSTSSPGNNSSLSAAARRLPNGPNNNNNNSHAQQQQHAAPAASSASSAEAGGSPRHTLGSRAAIGERSAASMDLEDGLDDALEDVVRDALGSLSNKLGAQVSLPDLPLPRLMHQAGNAGKAAGGEGC
ncbi:MAG: hypothetical protein WDW38_010558 [Sanguina aurantia]